MQTTQVSCPTAGKDQGPLVTEQAGSNACATFHPEAYVRERWTKQFKVDLRPGRAGMATEQDVWFLQKI